MKEKEKQTNSSQFITRIASHPRNKKIALLTTCLFLHPCVRAESHQQRRARKLCSATLNIITFVRSSYSEFMGTYNCSQVTLEILVNKMRYLRGVFCCVDRFTQLATVVDNVFI